MSERGPAGQGGVQQAGTGPNVAGRVTNRGGGWGRGGAVGGGQWGGG